MPKTRAKRGTAKPMVRGDLSYLHEKLGQAISSAMFAETALQIASVFEVVSRGIDNELRGDASSPYLEDTDARRWVYRIKELIEPSEEDGRAPDAAERGTYQIRAQRMTPDEKSELARCMFDLYARVGDFGR